MLAGADDVAAVLGLSDPAELTEAQQIRLDGLLERVSDEFQRLTSRVFTTGPTTVRANVVDGRATIPGIANAVNAVTSVDGDEIDFEQDGNSVTVSLNGDKLPTGDVVVVDYDGAGPPTAVTALVASIVARHLTVVPGSTATQSVSMTAGQFSTRYADWMSSTGLFTHDELQSVYQFRIPVPTVVIHKL